MAAKKPHATPEQIERALALRDLEWSFREIAKEMGVHENTVRYWVKKAEEGPPDDKVERIREGCRQKWIEDAWDIVLQLNRIVKGKLEKGESGFKDAREAATVLGIYMDKIGNFESKARVREKKQTSININILPPDGYTTQVDQNTISVHGESDEVLSDDSGGGERKDVLALPPRSNDIAGDAGDTRDDSGIDLPQPE